MILKAPDTFFAPAPEGTYGAVCVDFVDIGEVETQWGPKHCCEIVWELDEEDEKGERYKIKQRYAASLSEKSNLYRDLCNWRGRKFTPEELAGFDSENVVGKPCMLTVVHNQGRQGGRVFANVGNVSALPKGMPPIEPSGDYVRRAKQERVEPADDNDVPF